MSVWVQANLFEVETITGGDRRSNTSCWMDLFVPVDLFTAAACGAKKWWMKTSVRPLTGSTSNLTYPYGNSSCPSAGPTPRKTSHMWNRWLNLLGSTRGSDPVLGGKGGLGGPDTEESLVPSYSRSRSTVIHVSVDSWQSAQELLLDVGAEWILKPKKPEGETL